MLWVGRAGILCGGDCEDILRLDIMWFGTWGWGAGLLCGCFAVGHCRATLQSGTAQRAKRIWTSRKLAMRNHGPVFRTKEG